MALKQHFGKKILELEEEKRTVQVSKQIIIYYVFDLYVLCFQSFAYFNYVMAAAREGSSVGRS